MENKSEFKEQDIIAYYNHCEEQYKLNWKLDKCLAMHYGYKDEANRSLEKSLLNMNAQLAKRAGISNQDYVLDAGCGVGGSSVYLAKHYGCRVHGITLPIRQVETATKHAKKFGLEDKLNFSQQSYLNTNFEDNSFDVVWAVESVCHAPDKEAFYNEAYRVLKPGGRLILADYFEENDIGDDGKRALKEWLDCWVIKDLSTIPQVESYLKKFTSHTIEHATDKILASSKYMYRMHYLAFIFHRLYGLFNTISPESEANFQSAKYQYQSLKKNYWSYRIITATK